ncbi:hypothetical protein JMJ77_0000222 [Colletotrichum scovillei]|uniref:Uncharacterized protein n=1 Tax=Colletotrichum scovillei TaxID=1209932 RepID=A0A9P7R908_9PEZI|nr:hypothetical protein JMJ77_0000222 [Colletotrichum scovillei]KAG7071425.1 hypothetical protein JMJ76_0004298 [Colletotrichum scovillei]
MVYFVLFISHPECLTEKTCTTTTTTTTTSDQEPRNQGGSIIRPDCLLLPSRPCYSIPYEPLPGRNFGFLTFPRLSLLSSSDFMFQPLSAPGTSHCASSRHGLAQHSHICTEYGQACQAWLSVEIMDMTGRVG